MASKIGFKNSTSVAEKKFHNLKKDLYATLNEIYDIDHDKGDELAKSLYDDIVNKDSNDAISVVNLTKLEIAGLTYLFQRLYKGEEPYVKLDNTVIYNVDYAPIQNTEHTSNVQSLTNAPIMESEDD